MLRTSILILFHNLVVDGKSDLLKCSVRLAKRVKFLNELFLMNNLFSLRDFLMNNSFSQRLVQEVGL